MSETKHGNSTGRKKTSDNFTEYKRLRNMTDALIKKAKKDFVKIKIKESCPKKLWKTLKNLGIPTKVNEASSNIGLKNEDDDVCFDSDFVANKCNRYFCNIAEKLVDKLPSRTKDPATRNDFVNDIVNDAGGFHRRRWNSTIVTISSKLDMLTFDRR